MAARTVYRSTQPLYKNTYHGPTASNPTGTKLTEKKSEDTTSIDAIPAPSTPTYTPPPLGYDPNDPIWFAVRMFSGKIARSDMADNFVRAKRGVVRATESGDAIEEIEVTYEDLDPFVFSSFQEALTRIQLRKSSGLSHVRNLDDIIKSNNNEAIVLFTQMAATIGAMNENRRGLRPVLQRNSEMLFMEIESYLEALDEYYFTRGGSITHRGKSDASSSSHGGESVSGIEPSLFRNFQ